MFKRALQMALPQGQSAFLWGARQTGKSSYLKQHFPHSQYYDLLNTTLVTRFTKEPHLLRQEIQAMTAEQLQYPVIIDEIQKVPDLLNEVHWLIENEKVSFILCGSSARKLRTSSVNLLGGRAWPFHFYPLTTHEIVDFDLLRALQHGLLPRHYLATSQYIDEYLRAYVEIYLTDEIQREGLVRNLPGFYRFLDVAGLCNGEILNFNNIARDCAIDRSTVRAYYQILVDTLLGSFIYPYAKKIKRDLITSAPKFYLFDIAVANYLAQKKVLALRGDIAGKSFEHFIFMELSAYLGLHRKREKITYWRTKTGLEVDFVLGDARLAIEVKISEQVHQQDLKGLIAFCEEHPETQAVVVSQDPRARALKVSDDLTITIYPWSVFLEKLWADDFNIH